MTTSVGFPKHVAAVLESAVLESIGGTVSERVVGMVGGRSEAQKNRMPLTRYFDKVWRQRMQETR